MDILRCGEPDNIAGFKVNREPFAAVIKVCKSKEYPGFLQTLGAGDAELLGYRAAGQAEVQKTSDQP